MAGGTRGSAASRAEAPVVDGTVPGQAPIEPPDRGLRPEGRPLPQLVGELTMSAWGLAALASADETGLLDELRDGGSAQALARRRGLPAPFVEAVLDVLVALGLVRREGRVFVAGPTLTPALSEPARSSLRAELRSNLLQSARMVEGAEQGDAPVGWRHTESRILQAQGRRSGALVGVWVEHVFPRLEGLLERLEGSGGAFLDVGVGVAALPIGMCNRFPRLRAAGLDPLEPALVEARRNIEAAGLADRIDLRAERLEHLDDDSAYDLIHLPTMFAPAEVLREGLGDDRYAPAPVLRDLVAAGRLGRKSGRGFFDYS